MSWRHPLTTARLPRGAQQQGPSAAAEQAHYSETVYGGLRGGLAGLALGGAGAVALQRAQVQSFTRLTLPLKAFAVT